MIDDQFLHTLGTVRGFGNLRDGFAGFDVVHSNIVFTLVVSIAFLEQT
jgi:hypothetical protein